MKESTGPSALGYITAFTLGIICMGVIVLVMRKEQVTVGPSPQASAESSAPGERIHFQRDNPARLPNARLPFPPGPRREGPRPSMIHSEVPPTPSPEVIPSEPSEPAPDSAPVMAVARDVIAVPAAAFRDVRQGGGRVAGRAFLKFKPPKEMDLPLDPRCAAEFRAAGRPPTTRHFLVGRENGLENVFIVIIEGLPDQHWPVPVKPVILRLRGCIYENPIVGVQIGQPLRITNRDGGLHNVHNISERGAERNLAMLPKGPDLEFVFQETEDAMRFKCDVHPWEFAYVTILDHPFYTVTDANGNFAITGLPPGRYTLEARHRKAGILRHEIKVEDRHNVPVNFEFRQMPPRPENI